MWSGFRSGVGDAARAGGVVDASAELFSFGAEDGWDGMVLFIFYAGFFVGSVAGIFWFLSGAPKNHMRKKISGVLSLPNALCVYNDNRRWDDVPSFCGPHTAIWLWTLPRDTSGFAAKKHIYALSGNRESGSRPLFYDFPAPRVGWVRHVVLFLWVCCFGNILGTPGRGRVFYRYVPGVCVLGGEAGVALFPARTFRSVEGARAIKVSLEFSDNVVE